MVTTSVHIFVAQEGRKKYITENMEGWSERGRCWRGKISVMIKHCVFLRFHFKQLIEREKKRDVERGFFPSSSSFHFFPFKHSFSGSETTRKGGRIHIVTGLFLPSAKLTGKSFFVVQEKEEERMDRESEVTESSFPPLEFRSPSLFFLHSGQRFLLDPSKRSFSFLLSLSLLLLVSPAASIFSFFFSSSFSSSTVATEAKRSCIMKDFFFLCVQHVVIVVATWRRKLSGRIKRGRERESPSRQ